MNSKYETLKALARGACSYSEEDWFQPEQLWSLMEKDDATYVSAASPFTLLALISENERLQICQAEVTRVTLLRSLADELITERDQLRAENERLKGLLPEMPPRPPDGDGLPRYGLRWNGPAQPLSVPMDDGYWTPWHLADAIVAALRQPVAGERGRTGYPDADLALILLDRIDAPDDEARIDQLEQIVARMGNALSAPAAGQGVSGLVEALRDARELIAHGDFREGHCMCGSSVDGHGIGDGHAPTDAGEYYAGQVAERIDAALAAHKAGGVEHE